MSIQRNVDVSIICCTYNQVDYIRDAIDSFLAQETTYSFEIIVNDDASTDGTTEVLKMYQAQYPELIHLITHTTNHYRDSLRGNICEYALPIARGRFIALCEGDDYWVANNKLQRQAAFMDEHHEFSLCVHASVNVHERSKRTLSENKPYRFSQIIPYEDMIYAIHPFATNSYFMRRSDFNEYSNSPVAYCSAHGDHKMSLFFGAIGKTYYFNEVMSAYRVSAKGSVNSRIQQKSHSDRVNYEKQLLDSRIELLSIMNAITNNQYSREFEDALSIVNYNYYKQIGDIKRIKATWPNLYASESTMDRLKIRLRTSFPTLYLVFKRIIRH